MCEWHPTGSVSPCVSLSEVSRRIEDDETFQLSPYGHASNTTAAETTDDKAYVDVDDQPLETDLAQSRRRKLQRKRYTGMLLFAFLCVFRSLVTCSEWRHFGFYATKHFSARSWYILFIFVVPDWKVLMEMKRKFT